MQVQTTACSLREMIMTPLRKHDNVVRKIEDVHKTEDSVKSKIFLERSTAKEMRSTHCSPYFFKGCDLAETGAVDRSCSR